jgi:hypothetical protein
MIIDDLKSEIGNLNGASRRLASIVTAIERQGDNDPECVAICAKLLNTVGEFRDRLTTIRIAPLARVRSHDE